MKKLSVTLSSLVVVFAFNAQAENIYMPKYLQEGLVKICKSAATDKLLVMNKTIREFRLKHKTVALNVVCNGRDIISFADHYGAEKTTARLSNSVGRVEVTDIASLMRHKMSVNFEF